MFGDSGERIHRSECRVTQYWGAAWLLALIACCVAAPGLMLLSNGWGWQTSSVYFHDFEINGRKISADQVVFASLAGAVALGLLSVVAWGLGFKNRTLNQSAQAKVER